MTPTGQLFITNAEHAKILVSQGINPFVAMSCSFDKEDWLLVWAAVCALVEDIKKT